MDHRDLLIELFDRVSGHVHEVTADLDADDLRRTVAAGSNPIGWLLWHLTRVQDHHVSHLLGEDQLWMTDDWPEQFGLDADPDNTGYAHSPADVLAVQPHDASTCAAYYDAVASRTRSFIETLSPGDLDRVVDKRWDPPVTLGVRLVSIADDDIQHAGQAKYLKGLLRR